MTDHGAFAPRQSPDAEMTRAEQDRCRAAYRSVPQVRMGRGATYAGFEEGWRAGKRDAEQRGDPGGWHAVANDFQRAMFSAQKERDKLREGLLTIADEYTGPIADIARSVVQDARMAATG